jgi:uncharacterized lipoprotein
MRALTVFLVLALSSLVGACHLRHSARPDECAPGAAYGKAEGVAPLRAPDGMAMLNTHNSLKVPDEVAAATAHKAGTTCLDAPPSFFGEKAKPAPATK